MVTRRTISPAILLTTREMGESDLLVELFTKSSGVVVGIAKGAKKSMKRFVNTFDTANLITAKFYRPKGRELFIIEDASLIDSFPHLSGSIALLAYGEFTLELLKEFAPEGVPQEGLFDDVASFFSTIDGIGGRTGGANGSSMLSVEGLFWSHTVKFLRSLGIDPLFGQCVRCGRRFDADTAIGNNSNGAKAGSALFVPSAGGMVCGRCLLSREGGVSFSKGTILTLTKIREVPVERLSVLKFTRASLKEIRRGLLAFIRHQAGHSIKSADFMERYLKGD